MTDPYRTDAHPCPSCGRPLRWFRERLVCDACEGILAPLSDLARAIEDLTGVAPGLEFVDEPGGARPCPCCQQPMIRCHLHVELDGKVIKPRPELDRCDAHGVWFDTDELADVFEIARAKHPGGSTVPVRPIGASTSWGSHPNWAGDEHGFVWWKFYV